MKLTNSEKLILIMLSEVYEKLGISGQKGIDPKFVQEAIYTGNTWGFEWKYSGIFDSSEPAPPEVNEVVNYLDMWYFIEEAYEELDAIQKADLEQKAAPFGKNPHFLGFDGNNESEYMSTARFMMEQLDRFTKFKGRDLNTHMPSVAGYRRMYETFEPIRRTLLNRRLTVDELASVLNARRYRTGE